MSTAVLDITSSCNLRCNHCYNADKYFKNNVNDMSTEEIKDLVELLSKDGYTRLHLLGGEPLMRDDLSEVLKKTEEHNIKVSLTTNGILLEQNKYAELLCDSIETLFISIDGSDADSNDSIRGKGTFQKVIKNVLYLQKVIRNRNSDLKINLSCVVTENNIHNIHNLLTLCKKVGVRYLVLTPLIKSGNALTTWENIDVETNDLLEAVENTVSYAEKTYPELTFQIDARPSVIKYLSAAYSSRVVYTLNHVGCDVLANRMIYITADGNVHPCGLYTMEAGQKMEEEGYFNSKDSLNITKIKNIEEAEDGVYFRDFKSNLKSLHRKEYSPYCKECLVSKDCYPCSFQFKDDYDVEDCRWAFGKRKELEEKAGKTIITFALNNKSKYIKNEFHRQILMHLKVDETISDNYYLFKRLNCKIHLIDYMEAINNFRRKFLVRVKKHAN